MPFLILILSLFLPMQMFASVEIVSEDASGVTITYRPDLKQVRHYKAKHGFDTFLPSIKYASDSGGFSGDPYHLIVSENITIPNGTSYRVRQIGHIRYNILSNVMTPRLSYLDKTLTSRDYVLGENYFEPKDIADFKYYYAGIAKDKHLLRIEFTAARFDALSGDILIPKEITLRIDFTPDNNSQFKKRNNKFNRNSLQSSVSKQNWVKIQIPKDGVYSISKGDLLELGVDVPANKISTIKLYGTGGKPLAEVFPETDDEIDYLANLPKEQEIIVRTNSDGSLKNIIFFGAGTKGFEYDEKEFDFKKFNNYYSFENFYTLTWDGEVGIEAQTSGFSGEIEHRPSTYIHRLLHEDELVSPFSLGASRQFFGDAFNKKTYTNMLHELDRFGKIKYKITVAHKYKENATFSIQENGAILEEKTIFGLGESQYAVARRRASEIVINSNRISNDNRSRLDFEYLSSGIPPGYLDFFEIHYPRSFMAINNELNFFSEPALIGNTEYSVGGFSNKEKFAFDITDRANPKLLQNYANDKDKIIIRKSIESVVEFYISSELQSPTVMQKVEIADLLNDYSPCDVIVITHKDLLASATKYKEYREGTSDLKFKLVTTDDIYYEFSSGLPDVTAIRDYVAYLIHNLETKPSYLVLWGDGHTDYRKVSVKETNFVPPYLTLDDVDYLSETGTSSYDDFYAMVVGNDRITDIAMGRIPVENNEEGMWFVEKLDIYENKSSSDGWRTRVSLLADDGISTYRNNEREHLNDSEDLSSNYLPKDMQQKKIYLVEYPTQYSSGGRRKATATLDLIKIAREDGTLMMNWTGHGNPNLWAHEKLFEKDVMLPKLTNLDKLFFLTAATCEFGRFDKSGGKAAAEEMLFSKIGGSIAIMAATRLVYSSNSNFFTQLFYSELFKRHEDGSMKTLGEALYKIKQKRYGSNDQKYFLMGDPLLVLNIPDKIVSIDMIDNVITKDNEIPLEGLKKIHIQGRILNKDSSHDLGFNGNLSLTIYDGERSFSIVEEGSTFNFEKYGGMLNRAISNVQDGVFDISVTIPKDISYSDNYGRMLAYAVSGDEKSFARGSFSTFKVSGIDETATSDGEGPGINLFVDSRNFKAGDIISANPALIVDLRDTEGINSTGYGIGHRIEAWVNNNPNGIDLTGKYELIEEDYGSASEKLTGLVEGRNTVIVRVWDIFNNYSVDSTYFYVNSPQDQYWIGEIITYPNPIVENTTIRFRHNLDVESYNKVSFEINEEVESVIEIYSANGVLLRTLKSTLSSGGGGKKSDAHTAEVEWDGLDENGFSVGTGAFAYNITLSDGNGKIVSKVKMVAIK